MMVGWFRSPSARGQGGTELCRSDDAPPDDHGFDLRPQSDLAKARYAAELERHVWPLIAAGKLRPVMDSEYALADAAKAHWRMESSGHIGKIVLKVA